MDTAQLVDRVGPVDLGVRAKLDSYRLCFNKRSVKDEYGRANIAKEKNALVEGVLFALTETQFAMLDRWEGRGYKQIKVKIRVLRKKKIIQAVTYIALKDHMDDNLRPSNGYVALILKGAKQYSLPKSYIKKEILSQIKHS